MRAKCFILWDPSMASAVRCYWTLVERTVLFVHLSPNSTACHSSTVRLFWHKQVAISTITPAYLVISSVRTPVTLRPLPSMLPHVNVVLGMDWTTANRAVINVCAGTCTIIVAGNPRVLRACHVAASSAPVHEHARFAALRMLRANPLFISATQADTLLKQGCKARLVLVTGHRHTGTACALCASTAISGQVTAQGLDPDKLAALLDKKHMVFQSFPAGLPPDQLGFHPKTAFITPFGLYQFRVLSFGLTNAPATFQRLVNKLFAPYIGKFVQAYLDDIIIMSKTPEEHLDHLSLVLELLEKHKLYAKLSKCEFGKSSIKFFGHIVGASTVSVDPDKIAVVRDWPLPRNLTELRSFLGLANYFRRLVKDYSRIAAPLTSLTSDKVVFDYSNWPAAELAVLMLSSRH
jgi:hypothetical protein